MYADEEVVWEIPNHFDLGIRACIKASNISKRPIHHLQFSTRYSNHLGGSQLEIGDIQIDFKTMEARVGRESESAVLDLTPIEFKILGLLASEANRVFSRDEMLSRIWGEDLYIYPRSVDTHVSKLRKKMGSYGEMIRSVHGVGYRLIPPADARAEEAPLSAADQLEMELSKR